MLATVTVPGDMFVWDFDVGDGSWFFASASEPRHSSKDFVTVVRGDFVLIISGLVTLGFEHGFEHNMSHAYVCLVNNALVWVRLCDLEVCRPVSTAGHGL